jgi:very-short-patch-repair endonuclease
MRRKIIPYNPKLKELARKLRNNGTYSEIRLWSFLKGKQMMGYDFHRQKPIDHFIVDFYCCELMLAIEIDGVSHNDKEEEDRGRQAKLESLGVRFLRFQDRDVRNHPDGVVMAIEDWIKEHTPGPSEEGRKNAELTPISSITECN